MSKEITQPKRLKEIVRTIIAPAMKKAGFKKNGNIFNKTTGSNEDDFLLLESNRYNNKDSVHFTLEAYVMKKGETPIFNRHIECVCINHLNESGGQDYHLSPDVNSEELGNQIKQDISDYILPFFEKSE